jgi:hypothetical protein
MAVVKVETYIIFSIPGSQIRRVVILVKIVALMSKNYCISITVLVFQEMINYLLIVYISIDGYNIPYKWVFSREPKFAIFFQIGGIFFSGI